VIFFCCFSEAASLDAAFVFVLFFVLFFGGEEDWTCAIRFEVGPLAEFFEVPCYGAFSDGWAGECY